MRTAASVSGIVFGALAVLLLGACSGSSGEDKYPLLEIDDPLVEGPIAGDPLLLGTLFPLADVGYEQAEYFFSGSAHAYRNTAPLASDGRWQIEAADSADYKTRLVVYRPIDPLRFNGTVVVEWLNVTAGADGAVEWTTNHVELVRRGYAWVGVSAQKAGVDGEGIIPNPFAQPLKVADPVRYGSLSHPGDSFAYDIFTQALQALRHPGSVAPLGDLSAQRFIVAGESQSAFFLVTYVNSVGRRIDLADAYFIHSRGAGSAPLSQAPQEDIPTPTVVRVRNDLGARVLMFQTETDLFILGSAADRQDDSKRFRLWEVAGTAHADYYITIAGSTDLGDDPAVAQVVAITAPVPGFIECDQPINSGPQHFVAQAALAALNRWLVDGVAPTSAQRLALNEGGDGFAYDDLGNVQGGVRTPYVDAPIAVLSGEGQGGGVEDITGGDICFLFGTTQLFDEPALLSLYPDHEAYVVAVTDAADAAVASGFLVAEDAELIIQAADDSFVPYDGVLEP